MHRCPAAGSHQGSVYESTIPRARIYSELWTFGMAARFNSPALFALKKVLHQAVVRGLRCIKLFGAVSKYTSEAMKLMHAPPERFSPAKGEGCLLCG